MLRKGLLLIGVTLRIQREIEDGGGGEVEYGGGGGGGEVEDDGKLK